MRAARVRVASLAFGLIIAVVGGCGGEPCECRADAATPALMTVADVTPSPAVAPDAATTAAAVAPIVGESPRAALALKTLGELWAGAFGPIRGLMTDDLRAELTEAKLGSIVTGLVRAHGPMVAVMDAWTSTIREKDEVMPAAQALMKMDDGTRLGLMLVFDPQGAVKGLWLRPI